MRTLLIALLMAGSAQAGSGEARDIIFTGANSNESVSLRGQETHTEYRTETRIETCWRNELVGYQHVCEGGIGYPYPYPHPVPYPGPYRRCFLQPVYRQVPYSCERVVRIPYEVVDFDVVANVNVKFGSVPAGVSANETLKVSVNGANMSLSSTGSKALIHQLTQENIQVAVNGKQKTVTANYTVEFTEAAPVLAALSQPKASMNTEAFKLELGPMNPAATLSHSMEVWKLYVGSDDKLFDRALSANEVEVTPLGSRTEYKVGFGKLGVKFGRGKYSATMTTRFAPKGKLLNAADFNGALETEKTIVYKIR